MRSTPLILASALAISGCAAAQTDGDTVGPRGGMLVSDDGQLSVELREDSLADEMNIAVVSVDCESDHAVACYEFDPWGVMLGMPAWVVFDYQVGAGTEDMLPSQLTLQAEGAEGWAPMSDANYDAEEGRVWASVNYLTSISIVAGPAD